MLESLERESRPGGNGAAITNYEGDTSSLTDPAAVRHEATRSALTAAAVRSAIADELAAAVVRIDERGVVRRRVFLTLAAAERSVRRAEAAGQSAAVVLVRLSPAAVLGGGRDD